MLQSFAVRGQTYRQEECAQVHEGDIVELVPDTENQFHDTEKYPGTTAMKVVANEKHIGFVPAELCGWMAEHELQDLRLHRSVRSGMWTVVFECEEPCPRQGKVQTPINDQIEEAV